MQPSFRTERDTSRRRGNCFAVRRSHTMPRVLPPYHRVIFAVCWQLLTGETSAMLPALFSRISTSVSDASALSFVRSMLWIVLPKTPMAFEVCPPCSFTTALHAARTYNISLNADARGRLSHVTLKANLPF